MGKLEDLEVLQRLKESGAITADEFEKVKKKILAENIEIIDSDNKNEIDEEQKIISDSIEKQETTTIVTNKVCSKCGNELLEEDKYCGKCGKVSDFITINLKIVSIISLIVGTLYIIIGGLILWNIYLEDWGIVMAIEGIVFNAIGFSLLIKKILPDKKILHCFILGAITGILGVIGALCIRYKLFPKKKYKSNKYEDLARLQKLKEQGVITETEFEVEKSKLLK